MNKRQSKKKAAKPYIGNFTKEQIAKKAGVSEKSVQRYKNTPSALSEQMTKDIEKAIKKLERAEKQKAVYASGKAKSEMGYDKDISIFKRNYTKEELKSEIKRQGALAARRYERLKEHEGEGQYIDVSIQRYEKYQGKDRNTVGYVESKAFETAARNAAIDYYDRLGKTATEEQLNKMIEGAKMRSLRQQLANIEYFNNRRTGTVGGAIMGERHRETASRRTSGLVDPNENKLYWEVYRRLKDVYGERFYELFHDSDQKTGMTSAMMAIDRGDIHNQGLEYMTEGEYEQLKDKLFNEAKDRLGIE